MEKNSQDTVSLYADVGNSTIDFLAINGNEGKARKVDTHDKGAVFSYLSQFKDKSQLSLTISSVNQEGLSAILEFLSSYQKTKNIFLLSKESREAYAAKLKRKVDNLSYLGTDLFCDIIAEENKTGEIIIDLGTASKILYLSKENTFYGCLIFPGLSSFAEVLDKKTDQLGRVSLIPSPALVSLNTAECISSGTINGGASRIAGLVKARKEKYGCKEAAVYLTGGNAYLVKDRLARFGLKDFTYNPYHTRKGLRRFAPVSHPFIITNRRKQK